MRLIELRDIERLDDGEPIPAIEGTIETVFQRKTGEGQYGEYSFQDFVLTDGKTGVICTASGLDDFSDWKGETIHAECIKSEKHGLKGIEKKIDNYQGKTIHKVKFTATSKIIKVGNAGKPDPDWPDVERPMRPEDDDCAYPPQEIPLEDRPKRQTQSLRASPARPNGEDGILMARQHLMKSANLYCLCVDAVETVILPHITGDVTDEIGESMPAEHYQAAVSTLYIEASRAGMVEKMPIRSLRTAG